MRGIHQKKYNRNYNFKIFKLYEKNKKKKGNNQNSKITL